jgi:hypothetical protein
MTEIGSIKPQPAIKSNPKSLWPVLGGDVAISVKNPEA